MLVPSSQERQIHVLPWGKPMLSDVAYFVFPTAQAPGLGTPRFPSWTFTENAKHFNQ
jgi:hypothetical protein